MAALAVLVGLGVLLSLALLVCPVALVPLLLGLLVLWLVLGRAPVLASLLVTGLGLLVSGPRLMVAAARLVGLLRGRALSGLLILVGLVTLVGLLSLLALLLSSLLVPVALLTLLALIPVSLVALPESGGLVLLLVAARRAGMAASGLLVPAPSTLLSLLVAAVLLVVVTRLVVLLRLLVRGGALVEGLVLVPVSLVRMVAPLVGVAGLSARSLAELATAGLLLVVVLPGRVLPVFPLVGPFSYVLILVVLAARTVLLALALLAVMGRVGMVLLVVGRYVVGPM